MKESRREFLQSGLVVAGALGLGLGGANLAKRRGGAFQPTPAALTSVLTPDGRLIKVDISEAVEVHPSETQPEASVHAHAHSGGPDARLGEPGRKWIMVIDLARCCGCGNCAAACAEMHHTPPEREWMRVLKKQDSPHTAPYWFPKPCFHCDNPPCTKVCPVGATFKRQDGIVLIDNERCIGCRFCMAACPYSTRSFNWGRPQEPAEANQPYSPEKGFPRQVGTVEKCDFCPEYARAGELPPCVTECDMGAIYFGDQNEDAVTNSYGETERFSRLMEVGGGYRYLEDMGTKPRVYYLPPKSREFSAPTLAKADHGIMTSPRQAARNCTTEPLQTT
jgi:Fe-S-cluster-containing dehydrogenase component